MANGIDVSSYQGGINLANIAGDFVIIKATQGTNYVNPYMIQQINSARAGGKKIGLYHYAAGGGIDSEMQFFVNTIKPYLKDCFIALDFEADAVELWGAFGAESALELLKKLTAKTPLLYIGLGDENRLSWSKTATETYPLWVAQYNNYNWLYGYQPRAIYGSLKHWTKWSIFQYAAAGKLNGWGGALDFNVASDDLFTSVLNVDKPKVDEEEIEMSWHPLVDADTKGVIKINNPHGALVYSDKELAAQTSKRLDNGTCWKVFDVVNGAVNVGTNQWVNSADGLLKMNALAFNANARGIGQVTAENLFTQNELGPAKGIKHLPGGSKWVILGIKDGYFKVGNENTGLYADANKMKVVL